MTELRDEVSNLRDAAVEHRVRLENGSKVFNSWDDRIAEIERRTMPKPISIIKVVGMTIGVFMALAGALWALSEKLADRPTTRQIDSIMDKHQKGGHKETREEIRAIQVEQVEQRTLLEGTSKKVDGQGAKLDQLLERVPKPAPPRRRRRNP
jgi:hypothetical protein